jgi:hypothetical protein
LKAPWNCPYCKLKSTRRWNVSTHIQRKHPGHYNPLPEMKQSPPFSSYFSQPQNQSTNSNIPRDDFFDPAQIFEKTTKFQNILNEVRKMNKIEINFLLQAISNLPNFKNYSNSLF